MKYFLSSSFLQPCGLQVFNDEKIEPKLIHFEFCMQLYFFMPEASLIIQLGKNIVFVFLFLFWWQLIGRQVLQVKKYNFFIIPQIIIPFYKHALGGALEIEQHFKDNSMLINNKYLCAKLLYELQFMMINSIKQLAVQMMNSISRIHSKLTTNYLISNLYICDSFVNKYKICYC